MSKAVTGWLVNMVNKNRMGITLRGGYLFDGQYVGEGVIGSDPYFGIPDGVEGAGDASQSTDTTVSNNRFYGNGSVFGIVIDTYNQLDMYDEGHGISSFNIDFDLLTPHTILI